MDEPWRWSSRFNLIVLDSPFFSIYMTSRTKLLTGPSSAVLLRRCDRDISSQLHTPRIGTFYNLVDDRFSLAGLFPHVGSSFRFARGYPFAMDGHTSRHAMHPHHGDGPATRK